ncbi:MAG: winged helix-turn-helix domain-containing protein, partial [Reyranella sp.]
MARGDFLSAAAARRIALAAQGFGIARPESATNLGHVRRAIDRLGLLQIDSVNVLARAHYLPLFSRLGNYDSDHLDRLAWGRKSQRGLFEFWAHEASLLPLSAHPLFRWSMQRARENVGNGKGKLHVFRREKAKYIDGVLREIADRGPLAASELSNAGERRGAWWGWNDGKLAVEWLFFAGLLTTATRRGTFERVYDLTERVLPAHIRALPTPSAEEAQRELLRLSARALGVATEFDLRDYFRLGVADTKARLAELVEMGDLLPVAVEGWTKPAYLDPAARQPRKVEARALLAPFDPLIWERDRTHR